MKTTLEEALYWRTHPIELSPSKNAEVAELLRAYDAGIERGWANQLPTGHIKARLVLQYKFQRQKRWKTHPGHYNDLHDAHREAIFAMQSLTLPQRWQWRLVMRTTLDKTVYTFTLES